ncbi:MAG: DUF120 domain-containing protein [Candidatus Bathyarchaeia archaeon]
MRGEKIFWRNVPIILKLIELGAWKDWIYVSTIDLASDVGLPQQTISRVLNELNSNAFIEKKRAGRKSAVRLTDNCLSILRSTYEKLIPIFEEHKTFRFSGVVLSGFGDGEHYVRVYMDKFEDTLKFKPYPGTLNLKIVDLNDLKAISIVRGLPGLKIEKFSKNGRPYGAVRCYPALIGGEVNGAIVVPERTHYGPDIVELIAPENLRKRFNLKNGDRISVEVKVNI